MIDPMRIPQTVGLTPLTTADGTLAACGRGEKPVLSLKEWQSMFRGQQVRER
jgi:type III restriction enzyme